MSDAGFWWRVLLATIAFEARPFLDVLDIQEILSEFLLTDLIR